MGKTKFEEEAKAGESLVTSAQDPEVVEVGVDSPDDGQEVNHDA